LRSYYIKYRNIFTRVLRATKNNFYKKKFTNVLYSPKLTWELIKEDTLSKNIKVDAIKTLIHNNEHIIPSEDPMRVSNLFNVFFTNIGSNLASKIIKSNLVYDEPSTNASFNMIFEEKINMHEIIKIINNLNYFE